MRTALLLLAMTALTATAAAQRQELTTVYSQYFTSFTDDSIPPLLTLNGAPPPIEKSPRGMRLLGRLEGGHRLVLRLTDLPPHEKLRVHIGFHIIGSWDGTTDDDRFTIRLDDGVVFDHTFSNTIYTQS